MPQVAVLMSVYERVDPGHLEKAIASILGQTFDDFQFTIIADGRLTSHQQEILKRYAAADTRLRILQNDRRMGLAYSMNLGISASDSAYIARMDADDLSDGERLEKQVAFLEQNQDIHVVGTFADEIDSDGSVLFQKRLPVCHRELALFLAKRDPFVHPSVMFRREFFMRVGLYNTAVSVFEDTELWCRAFARGLRGANIPEFLYRFRIGREFFKRRRGWRYAWLEARLRWEYIRECSLPPYCFFYPLAIIAVRSAPVRLVRVMYKVAR